MNNEIQSVQDMKKDFENSKLLEKAKLESGKKDLERSFEQLEQLRRRVRTEQKITYATVIAFTLIVGLLFYSQ